MMMMDDDYYDSIATDIRSLISVKKELVNVDDNRCVDKIARCYFSPKDFGKNSKVEDESFENLHRRGKIDIENAIVTDICLARDRLFWCNSHYGIGGSIDINNVERKLVVWSEDMEETIQIKGLNRISFLALEENAQTKRGRIRLFNEEKSSPSVLLSRLIHPICFDVSPFDGSLYIISQVDNKSNDLSVLYLNGTFASQALPGPNPALRRKVQTIISKINRNSVDIAVFKDMRIGILRSCGTLEIWSTGCSTPDIEIESGILNLSRGSLTRVPFQFPIHPSCDPNREQTQLIVTSTIENRVGTSACVWSFENIATSDDDDGKILNLGDEIGSFKGPFHFGPHFPKSTNIQITNENQIGSCSHLCFCLEADGMISMEPLQNFHSTKNKEDLSSKKLEQPSVFILFCSQYVKKSSSRKNMAARLRFLKENGTIMESKTKIVVHGTDHFCFEENHIFKDPGTGIKKCLQLEKRVQRLLSMKNNNKYTISFVIFGNSKNTKEEQADLANKIAIGMLEYLLKVLVVVNVTMNELSSSVFHESQMETISNWSTVVHEPVEQVGHFVKMLENNKNDYGFRELLLCCCQEFQIQIINVGNEQSSKVVKDFIRSNVEEGMKNVGKNYSSAQAFLQQRMNEILELSSELDFIGTIDEDDSKISNISTLYHANLAKDVKLNLSKNKNIRKKGGRTTRQSTSLQVATIENITRQNKFGKTFDKKRFYSVPVRFVASPPSSSCSSSNNPPINGRKLLAGPTTNRILFVQCREWVDEVFFDKEKDNFRPKAIKALRVIFARYDTYNSNSLEARGIINFVKKTLKKTKQYLSVPEAAMLIPDAAGGKNKPPEVYLFIEDYFDFFSIMAKFHPKFVYEVFQNSGLKMNLELATESDIMLGKRNVSMQTGNLGNFGGTKTSEEEKERNFFPLHNSHEFWSHVKIHRRNLQI